MSKNECHRQNIIEQLGDVETLDILKGVMDTCISIIGGQKGNWILKDYLLT